MGMFTCPSCTVEIPIIPLLTGRVSSSQSRSKATVQGYCAEESIMTWICDDTMIHDLSRDTIRDRLQVRLSPDLSSRYQRNHNPMQLATPVIESGET